MSGHIASPRLYVVIFLALMVLTILTVAVAKIDLGYGNLPIALAIAVVKGSLVVLFFMHVKYSPRLVQVAAGAGFLWLGVMVLLTMSDYLTRGILGVMGK